MKKLFLSACLLLSAPAAWGQDFYDVDVLRTVDLTFHDANWWTLLAQNYQSQTNILADLTVEGVTYPDVGVRIRGNTSYTQLPPGAEKVSLNVEVDYTHDGQEVMGYKNLNFNNAHRDPTFCREVVYYNILARWIPSGRANHIVLTLNGANWGVYANIQQYDKTMLREFFADEDGLRIKCANKPQGPGLQYFGSAAGLYGDYEVKDDGGFADPIGELITICDAVDNLLPADWMTIDETFAIDPSTWTVVMENLFSDDDSYIHKGADFMLYRNPTDGRAHLHQADGNETFTNASWSSTFNFSSPSKPVLSNVLASTEMRGRYFAHLRSALAELDWTTLGPVLDAHRNLIDAAVQTDPKRLYSYQNFLNNFTTSVSIGGGGPGGGSVLGLQQYVNQRRALLLFDAEVAAVGPTIDNVAASGDQPGVPVHITATVTAVDPIASVYLYYLPAASGPYDRIAMADDGLSNDGAAGDGVYGVQLPVTGGSGQSVPYYVGATAQNTYLAQSFSPARTEMEPLVLTFATIPGTGAVVINEFLAKNDSVIQDPAGDFEDYVELFNRSGATVDLSGMYLTDDLADPTAWQIPTGTTIDAGQTLLIWADDDPSEGPLHAEFKLSASGEEIGLFEADGTTLVDSVVFGEQISDVSTGLLEDGGSLLVTFPAPTPDALNDSGAGIRAYDQLDPTVHPVDLTAVGSGAIGTTVTFTASNLTAGDPVVLAYGHDPLHLQIRPEVVVLMLPEVFLFGTADGSGVMDMPLTVPALPSIVGVDCFFQACGVGSPSSLEASNALHLTIGP